MTSQKIFLTLILFAEHLLKELLLIQELNLGIRTISKYVFVIRSALRDFSCPDIEFGFFFEFIYNKSPPVREGLAF